MSIEQGYFSNDFKHARVIPLYRLDLTIDGNYRPVFLYCVVRQR